MKFKTMMAAAAAITMTASPVLAASAAPATKLSVSNARVGTPSTSKNALGGGGAGLYALAILAGVAAIIIVDATRNDNDDRPASS